ncbi:uncharacterized protein LOC131249498 [Magnolia sinica]|uniref:uncharacterized protein LOC131249498 n=1 Tax=Magnolia sinica TaxID=86752 RepID=UPI002658260E|nr:uncharacterized protein LOC131249498 [Magnolia sinica]
MEQQLDKKHKLALDEEVDKAEVFCVDKLKETVNKFLPCCCKRQRNLESNRRESEDPQGFIMHLEGEDDLVHLIMESGQQDTEKWIERGRNNKPTDLINLLKSNLSEGFNGVAEFDSSQIPPIGEKPPNCWALPVVTLTSIAVALRYIDENTIRSLRQAVSEDLRYVRLIEANLDANESSRINDATDIVWRGTDVYDRWLDKDLHKLVTEEKYAAKIIRRLSEIAKESSKFHRWACPRDRTRIGETILQDYEDKFGTVDKLFQWLRKTIANILGAYLTNLPRVISMECFCGVIEVREDCVRDVAYLLGEAETILVILGEHMFPDLDPDQMANIDEWRFSKLRKPCLLSLADNV